MTERPYADYTVVYGPLGHLVLGALMAITRLESVWIARAYFAANGICLLWLAAKLASTLRPRHLGSRDVRVTPLVAASVVLLSPLVAQFAFYSAFHLNLVLVGALLTARHLRDPRRPWIPAAAAGFLVVVTALARLNFGAYLGVAGFGALLVDAWRRRDGRALGSFTIAALLTAVAAAAWAAAAGWLTSYVDDTLAYLPRFRAREIPIGIALQDPLPLLSLIGAALGTFFLLRPRVLEGGKLLIILLAASFGSYAVLRFDPYHYFPLVVIIVVGLLAWAPPLAPWLIPRDRRTVVSWAILVLVALLSAPITRPLLGSARSLLSREVSARTRAGFTLSESTLRLVEDAERRLSRDDEIFVASYPGSCECNMHWCANMATYLALGHLPRGRQWIIDTAISPYEDAQQEMVEHLERSRTRLVAFERLVDPRRKCGVRVVGEATVLLRYVERRYRLVGTFTADGAPTYWLTYERAQ